MCSRSDIGPLLDGLAVLPVKILLAMPSACSGVLMTREGLSAQSSHPKLVRGDQRDAARDATF
jgi:hypothetical protein